jgi:transposase-like protein/DDE family transposase
MEYENGDFGDRRLTARQVAIAEAMSGNPDRSFPKIMSTEGELEALYRFVNNKHVSLGRIIEPHVRATCERAATERHPVLAVHDTTGFSFQGESTRVGLGRIKTGGQGFYGHFTLVVTSDERHQPLGIVAVRPIFRTQPPDPSKKHWQSRGRTDLEFRRWAASVEITRQRLTPEVIHVMDSEADAYSLLAAMIIAGQRFVVRLKGVERALDVPDGSTEPRKLGAALQRAPLQLRREIRVSKRRPDKLGRLRKQPTREARTAKLEVRAAHVELKRPQYADGVGLKSSTLPRALPVNVVWVREAEPPQGQEPVEWALVTTEPIDQPEQIAAIIDHYRGRWLIEEYFKALKTGCSFEKRQLESKHALLNALGLFIPAAWRVLTVRYIGRQSPDADGASLISERQLRILRSRRKRPLSTHPTASDVMLAIAAEGGHLRNNGVPGWQTLGAGYEKLLWMELGYVIAEQQRSDQS